MTRIEWINLLALVVAVAAGGAYIGQLKGTLESLNPDEILERIEKTGDGALVKIREASDGVSDLHAEIAEWMERMERMERAGDAVDLGSLHPERFEWTQGSSPVQMIRVSEGICYLVSVMGTLDRGGDYLSVNARDDFWFLEGNARRAGARAQCWKFPTPRQAN